MNQNKKIADAVHLFESAMNGDLRAKAQVAESLTTSDFPSLYGQGVNRRLLAAYQAAPAVWQQYSTRVVLPNFKPQRLVSILGTTGLERVAEATEYPAGGLDEALYDFSVAKYGKRIGITWEMVVNDELGQFRGLDQILAQGARDLEGDVTAHALLTPDMKNVNTEFFRSANGNAPETVDLDRKALQDAIMELSTKKVDDRIVARPGLVLVVPPTLEAQARSILTATEIRTTLADGSVAVEQNPLAGSVQIVVEPRLLDSTHAKAATTWFILPAPNSARPALVTGFLAGHEAPDLRVKNDQGSRAGGGLIPAEQGSFDDDTIQYRVRHVAGAALIDPLHTFVSTGK